MFTHLNDYVLFGEAWKGNENAAWINMKLVCTVKYMMKTESGGVRQTVFKCLRLGWLPEDYIDNKN